MTAGHDTTGRDSVSQRSFGELMGEVTTDLSRLVRQEVELAKAELREDATRAGRTGATFAGAGFGGYMVLLFLSIAFWWALSNVMDQGWAALIVAVIWAVIAAVLYAYGRSQMKKMRGLSRTTQTVKEIPTALKPDTGGVR